MTTQARTTFAVVTAIVLIAVFAAAAFLVPRAAPSRTPGKPPAIVHLDEGTLRYTYHVATKTDSLFDISTDPRCLRNLARERAGDVARMRAALTLKMKLANLDDLQSANQDVIDQLHGLGYF